MTGATRLELASPPVPFKKPGVPRKQHHVTGHQLQEPCVETAGSPQNVLNSIISWTLKKKKQENGARECGWGFSRISRSEGHKRETAVLL